MNKLENTTKKLGEFAEKKRAQNIVNIENSTATGLILKWMFTNKVSVFLFFVIMFSGYYYKLQIDSLREQVDKARIVELQDDLVMEQTRTLELQRKLNKLQSNKEDAERLNRELRSKLSNLSLEQKRNLLLGYKKRLMRKRSIK